MEQKLIDINIAYQAIISKCRFVSKPGMWFIDGTEVECVNKCSYSPFLDKSLFNDGWSMFRGTTNQPLKGYTGSLPRFDGETCPFSEFFIYDEFGNEISELTLIEYNNLFKLNG